MGYEPNLITPFVDSGLKKYFKPFIIGPTAFPQISDAYPWRGSVRKREGYRLLASLPAGDAPVQGLKNWINPTTLNPTLIAFSLIKSYIFSAGVFSDITFFAYPTGGGTPVTGAPFSWSNTAVNFFWTANYRGSMWVTNNLTADHIKYWNGTPGVLNTSGGWSTYQPIVNGTTTLDAALIVLPYKGRLVFLNTTEGGVSYQNRARWTQIGTPYAGAATPTANQAITVGNPTSIQSNGHGLTTGDTVSFINFTGADAGLLNTVNFVVTRTDANNFTIPINTTGKTITVGSSVTQLEGVPYGSFVNDINAVRDDIPGKGGFIDADSSERIVSAEIVHDTLIVAFQRSTWRLRYTGNEILPFIWERLNTQYGAESTYSNVAFDESALFFSRYGWIAATTNDVARIDYDIPDDSFSFEGITSGLSGLVQVQGIRDFYRQMAYWTFLEIGNTVANQIYAYNYLDKSWSIYNPQILSGEVSVSNNIRTFGYFYNVADFTWSSFSATDDIWQNFDNVLLDTWQNFGAAQNAGFPYIVGGDGNGNVYQMFEFSQNPTQDAAGTASVTNFNYVIATSRFNPYLPQGQKCRLGYVDLYCSSAPGGEITVQHFVDDQNSPVFTRKVSLYSEGGLAIASITAGNPTTIVTTLAHNFLTGELVTLSSIYGTMFNALNNQTKAITVVDAFTFTFPIDTVGLTYTTGGYAYGVPFDMGSAKYTRIFLGGIGHMHQLVFTLSSAQLADPEKGRAAFEMQGLVAWTRPTGKIRG